MNKWKQLLITMTLMLCFSSVVPVSASVTGSAVTGSAAVVSETATKTPAITATPKVKATSEPTDTPEPVIVTDAAVSGVDDAEESIDLVQAIELFSVGIGCGIIFSTLIFIITLVINLFFDITKKI